MAILSLEVELEEKEEIVLVLGDTLISNVTLIFYLCHPFLSYLLLH